MRKKYEELVFTDDFMFCKVLQNDPGLCRELLELLIGEPVGELVQTDRQHPIEITPDGRGVRFDVYAKDDQSVIYDIEMQNAPRDNLPKRARYSQSLIDLDSIERGARFDDLNRSYVIFLCCFNVIPEVGRHRYAFRSLCIDDPDVELGDGTEKLFICTEGTKEDISPRLQQFLEYLTEGTASDDLTKRLQDAVEKARRDPRWRKEFMDFQDYMEESYRKGKEDGFQEGEQYGYQKGERYGVLRSEAESVCALIKNGNIDAHEALKLLDIPPDRQEEILQLVKERNDSSTSGNA